MEHRAGDEAHPVAEGDPAERGGGWLDRPSARLSLEELDTWARPGVVACGDRDPGRHGGEAAIRSGGRHLPSGSPPRRPRRLAFLPYPANYGFIPGTRMDKAQGGDGDAVDVFVLCEALPSGTVVDVEPIGVIELLDAGERDDNLVALPVDPTLRSVEARDMHELPAAARDLLVTCLLNYDPEDHAELVAVRGRQAALDMVFRWQVT
ncbi:MAG: inorganic diphosphatase [Flavobacteriales bacterium]|nr:inorganic diphosphatase [Flavobacteriales bacterium]